MKANIVLLPGDGIGPEVVESAKRVLVAVATEEAHEFTFLERDLGGVAIDRHGVPLPDETLSACQTADAVLLGAVGGPQWGPEKGGPRPEQGLLGLRQQLELFANLRPIPVFEALLDRAPIKSSILQGTNLLFVRELTGGLYFGDRQEAGTGDSALDTMAYSRFEITRVAHVAFQAAQGRSGRVTSIDKANVLATMRLWRKVVEEVRQHYPDVELDHQLVDSAAMRLLTSPTEFDVILTPNLFGDILSDEASVLAGSLGLLPSASLGSTSRGLYEPIHGSAPDIAGRGIANPLGAILSAAMLLRHSLDLGKEASRIETAVATLLTAGVRTADLGAEEPASTEEVTAQVIALLGESPEPSEKLTHSEDPQVQRCRKTGMV